MTTYKTGVLPDTITCETAAAVTPIEKPIGHDTYGYERRTLGFGKPDLDWLWHLQSLPVRRHSRDAIS
jgi:hypothetical protein